MGSKDANEMISPANKLAIKAAKKVLKKQEDGSMKIKALAKIVSADIEDHDVAAVKTWIQDSDTFLTTGKMVSLSKNKNKKRKRDDIAEASIISENNHSADDTSHHTEQGSHAPTVQVVEASQPNADLEKPTESEISDPPQKKSVEMIDVSSLEAAYRLALSAFKADKTNKDLRRAKSAARKAWDVGVAAMEEGEQITCKDCSQSFIFRTGEREFYTEQGWIHTPKRCSECKEARKVRLSNDRIKLDNNNGKNMCYDFQRGACTHGDECRFSHNPKHGGTPKEVVPAATPVSVDN
jgi:hypothetical protein